MQNSIDAAVIKVLLIEPNPVDASTFEGWLTAAKSPAFKVERAPNFEKGLAQAHHFDAILLGMPMIDVENLPRVSRMRDAAPATSLIVLLGHAKETSMLEALRLGAQDLLIKGELDETTLRRRIRFAITRKHDERLHQMPGERVGDLPEEALDVSDAIGSASLVLQGYAATQRVRLRIDVPTGLPHLKSDRDRLRQILINLLSNAIQFTPAAGNVTVSAGPTDEGGVELCVTDTGIGMSKSQLAMIGRDGGGPVLNIRESGGRGLPLTEYLIRQHGGSMKGETAPGGGTKITATFPAERVVQRTDPNTKIRKTG
ncbi:MAG: ATP-binding protein [Alphaproteobacteria bacterium]|nr:ATP-binding protein [Alphaproteobacteria bacterium]